MDRQALESLERDIRERLTRNARYHHEPDITDIWERVLELVQALKQDGRGHS